MRLRGFFSVFYAPRVLWFCIFFFCTFSVIIAHLFFQIYLFMPPCEQCVYLRLFMLVVAFGAFLGFLNPKLGVVAYAICAYAIIFGSKSALHLNAIHNALQSGNSFGLKPCKSIPDFPFGLKLDELYPSLFKPIGECGLDAPIVPKDAILSPLQAWFVDFYSHGWFVLPKFEFINMGLACFIIFILLSIILLVNSALRLKK